MNPLRDRQILGLVGRLLLWLPPAFLLWSLLANWLTLPLGGLAFPVLELLAPDRLAGWSQSGTLLVFDTRLQLQTPDGRIGTLVVEINPLLYAWNLPLLLALSLATDLRRRLALRLLALYAGLLPLQAWGVIFDFMVRTTFKFGPDISALMGYGPLGRELIVLAYQFGYLMLPAIGVPLLWMLLHRQFIGELLGTAFDAAPRPTS